MTEEIFSVEQVLEALRGGMDPDTLAKRMGTTELAMRRRMESAGLIADYKAACRASRDFRASRLDVEKLMKLADEGKSITRASIECGYMTGDVSQRLVSDGRWVEFAARWYSAESKRRLPAVDPEEYYDGPRAALLALMPELPPEQRKNLSKAVSKMDKIVKSGAELSRLCRGSLPCA